MPKPKNAVAYVEGLNFLCAECGEHISEPSSGSHLWTVYDAKHSAGTIVQCECGADNRIPEKFRPRMP